MRDTAPPEDPLLREWQVREMVPVSRSTFRRLIAEGRFPAGIRISARIRVWRLSVVQAWIKAHS